MRSGAILLASLLSLTSGSAAASPTEIFPLSEVKRGQKGYGKTTFYGTTPQKFSFEVLDVKQNFLPGMPLIIVKSDDPKIVKRGFWKGMSGSPLYINDKVACAFSYTWTFVRTPIGACTPIEYMIKQGFKTPVRGQAQNAKPGSGPITQSFSGGINTWHKLVPNGDLNKLILENGRSKALRVHSVGSGMRSSTDLQPAAIPLAVSGVSPAAFRYFQDALQGTSLTPMRAGGTGGFANTEGPDKFQFGSSIAVMLARGDMTIAGTGTVSYVDGPRVLAFGHPMFESGEFYAPIATSHVHMVVHSSSIAFVQASPIKEVGSLVLDRQAMIMGDTRLRTKMIPVSLELTNNIGGKLKKRKFSVEILNNQTFTPILARMATANAVSLNMPNKDPATVKVSGKIHVKGQKPLFFSDYLYSEDGASSAIFDYRGFRALGALLYNPFKPVTIERIEMDVEAVQDKEADRIINVKLGRPKLKPGATNFVDLYLQRRGEEVIRKRLAFHVPKELAGSIAHLQLVPGNLAKFDAGIPQDFPSLMKALNSFFRGDQFLIQLFPAKKGVSLNGTVVNDLPPSIEDRLATKSGGIQLEEYNPRYRTVVKVDRVIVNSKGFLVDIDELDE